MTWLLILFVALFVIAPVFWIMPTPAQRRQERMRARARALGLEIIGCELPQTRRQRVRGEPRRLGMLYRAPFPREGNRRERSPRDGEPAEEASRVVTGAGVRWLRERGGAWELDEAMSSTSAATPPDGLPATAVGYEITRGGVGLFWREGGDEDAVEQVATILLKERDRLL